MIRARWVLAVVVFVFVIGSAIGVNFVLPREYTSTASVVVDSRTDPLSALYPAQNTSVYLSTQVDIAGSTRVAERVVRTLRLHEAPETQQSWREATGGRGDLVDWLARSLQSRLSVVPSRDSSVLRLSVTWSDPRTAAQLANAFAQAYVETNIDMKTEPAKQYATWFDDRSRDLRADLEEKQRRLAEFERANGILVSSDLDIENARLNELSSQLVAIQTQRQQSQSRQGQAGGRNESLPEVLQSPIILTLKSELSRAEARQQDYVSRLGRNHPDYQTTAVEVARLRAQIEQETANIASSLGKQSQANLQSESQVQAALEAQKNRVLELRGQRDAASVLQNDVQAAQRDLEAVSQRLALSNLESQNQQANIVLLAPASEPLEPSSPRTRLNILLGGFLGMILGIAAALLREMSDRRIRGVRQLNEVLEAPVLLVLPDARNVMRGRAAPVARLANLAPSTA
jgi:chain length determinant protein EpsF